MECIFSISEKGAYVACLNEYITLYQNWIENCSLNHAAAAAEKGHFMNEKKNNSHVLCRSRNKKSN